MSPSSQTSRPLSFAALLTLSSLVPASWAMDCSDILTNKVHFNFKELGGPHIVHWSRTDIEADVKYNYNFTLDICDFLKHHKGGDKHKECQHGARVCGIRENVDLSGTNNATITPIDIAGSFKLHGNGRPMDEKYTRLKDSKSNADSDKEGVRIELHGGRFPADDKKNGLDQRAIIEFVCDPDRSGLEGEEKDGGEYEKDDGDDDKSEKKLVRRADKCEDSENSLRFCGYETEKPKDKEVQTLRLEWRTKHACEQDAPEESSSSHWGFFTWFIIIFFLATATYLIFGSWLNYNRYGARGWDLLPHGDTIRDIPYILKDFGRKVVNSTQGGGSRGGYSAV
ncbi:unnamed protein product [Periconia digitata]|uniref:Autophagy-related protein 27 n=1 Tax=Periconia digitata TaxID=1303443 RepID=A0A9W4XSS7_9PLEO|nr:unnamed protein product [Periconia digitata]